MSVRPVIVIHGGAGALSRASMTEEKEKEYRATLQSILSVGQKMLSTGKSAVDVVSEAVRLLEECPLFNAGHGSVLTSQETYELDAAIMDGSSLKAGAIACVSNIRNPILVARAVMEKSQHVMFVAQGAEAFAIEQGFQPVKQDFFFTAQRYEQLQRAKQSSQVVLDHSANQLSRSVLPVNDSSAPLNEDKKMGTVGAVALDIHGNLAAATSTGGMTNKQSGRVGDSPIIGAGCYANHCVAVSATGTGEMFIRQVVGHDIAALIEYKNMSLAEASNYVVMQKLPKIKGEGGVIAVDKYGNIALPFNSEGMYRGYAYINDDISVDIYR